MRRACLPQTTYGVMRRISDDEPTDIREINPEIPEWLCSVIAKLMSKRVEDRFGTAAEVAELLEQCLAHVQQPSTTSLPASLIQVALLYIQAAKGLLPCY